MTNELRPSLTVIRDRLFPGIRVARRPEPLDAAPQNGEALEGRFPFPLLPQLQALLEAREQIAQSVHTLSPGVAGQIVCIEILEHEHLRSGKAALPAPVFILLDAPRFNASFDGAPTLYRLASAIWQGWMVCPDADYMNEWDLLLNDTALREDACQFVQTWNRVDVYLPSVHRVAGLVDAALLGNIRHLANHFSTGQDDAAVAAAVQGSGQLVQRQLPHGWACSGTVQDETNESDTRNEYARLYQTYAELVSEAVWTMLHDAEAEFAARPDLSVRPQKNIGLLSRLLSIDLGAPSVLVGASAMSKPQESSIQVPVFRLDWEQDDCVWRMEGWKGGKVSLERINGSGLDPSSIAWSATGAKKEHYSLSREGDQLLVDISVVKAMRRAENIKAATDSDRVAALLPTVLP